MSLKKPANIFLNELMQKWDKLQQVPNVFSYQLEVNETKFLPGKYKFYAEYNPKRTALRRPPQTVTSLDAKFDEEKFNFKKVAASEVLMKLEFEEDTEISFIINNSPVTKYNTLICPNVESCLPQRITLDAIRFCVDFLLSLENNRCIRIGYNSPGALVSVNHLHLHLMFIENELYIDRAKLEQLSAAYDAYRLDQSMPSEAICFFIDSKNSKTKIEQQLDKIYKFLVWLCENNLPHNVFMTPAFQAEYAQQAIKFFVYVREKFCIVKDLYTCNLGFLEFSGFVPLGSKELYDNITEQYVLNKINAESGQVYNKIYKYLKEIS